MNWSIVTDFRRDDLRAMCHGASLHTDLRFPMKAVTKMNGNSVKSEVKSSPWQLNQKYHGALTPHNYRGNNTLNIPSIYRHFFTKFTCQSS